MLCPTPAGISRARSGGTTQASPEVPMRITPEIGRLHGAAIQTYAEAQGCSVVRDYVGHGIGREFHCAPQVPHYGKRGTGMELREGMTLTVEPMVNAGNTSVLSTSRVRSPLMVVAPRVVARVLSELSA